MGKEELISCFQDTLEKSRTGTLKRKTSSAIKSNRVYKEGFVSNEPKRHESTSVIVCAGTTFSTAREYRSLGKIAVLNFANPEYPGGGVSFGAMAQEECLCRSSNLYACISDSNVFDEYYLYHRNLKNHFYSDRLIYTKNVTVFKGDQTVPQLLPKEEWFEVDVITCAAPYLGQRKYTNAEALFALFKERIKNIFEAARDNHVDVIVLGAFGCGAFQNPPKLVAQAFREIIGEENFLNSNAFKQIVFAIKPTGEDCPNLREFTEQLECFAPGAGESCTLLPESPRTRFHKTPLFLKKTQGFYHWQWRNKYFGKQFSILGDSISTLEGYNPKGYNVFYSGDNCVKSGVEQMSDTWWDKVISFLGGELLVNNSWSGSRVTKIPQSDQLFPSGCSNERTSALHINNVKPDVIIVYLGTNDWAFGARPGNDISLLGEDDNERFEFAYDNMIQKLKSNYPNSEIWCCTLCETYISKQPDFRFPHKYAGTHIEEYNNIIRNAVRKNKCHLIDLYSYKMPYDSIDGSHPTSCGMDTIATMVLSAMSGKESDRFIQGHNHSRYVWGDKQVNEIRSVTISWGDLPIYYINIEDDIVRLYRKINGSRDGWMTFPDGYFDEKKKPLDAEEKRGLFRFLETIDFTKWKTNDTTIFNIENMATGFCVTESFQCVFDDGTTFYCANPPQSQFEEMVEYFKNFFSGENMEPFYSNVIPLVNEEASVLLDDNVTENSEYVMLDPNITTMLYSNTLRLTIESTGKTVQFQKEVVTVGKRASCDLMLDSKKYVSRQHATFFYEHQTWFLRDDFSTNGTWINGARIQPGKKYQLAANDEIKFATDERIFFYRLESNEEPVGDPDAKSLVFLEAGMSAFAQSDHTDEDSLKLILAALSDAPLYFPVEIDLEAMLGSVDPAKPKPGDTLQPEKDVKMRILTLTLESGIEFVPMFTSNDEVNKGPSASIIRLYPQDYLPKLIRMDKPVIINPFSENRFLLSKQLIAEVLLPLVQNKTVPNSTVEQPPTDKCVGQTIGGKYEILKLIGRGGFYTTYLVKDVYLNKIWAMKVCDKKHRDYSSVIREMILTELYMIKELDHPAIPKVVDFSENEDCIFVVRDYVEGETLETIVTTFGAQPADKVIEWSKQLCDVLTYLHSLTPPHIYRDMKPANVILKPDGTTKIIDFGIMRTYKHNKKCDTCCLGTKGYAAPEQFGGSQTDARTDIFGLGMTMFRLVTGMNPTEPPYQIKPICLVNPNLPKGLEYIISKCIQPNPDERYQTCDELMADLNNYQSLPKPKRIFSKLFGNK